MSNSSLSLRFISLVLFLHVFSLFGCIEAAAVLARRSALSTLSQNQISSFKTYTSYAAAAYCKPSSTLAWSCGANCKANPAFEPVASGGDGVSEQYWYVGYDPDLQSVVVGHQGTQPQDILPIIEDLDIVQEPLSQSLFPGISSSIAVHSGFRDAQARSAADILTAVNTAVSRFQAEHVTLVGHSLGGAISVLDAIYLSLHLPSSMHFSTVTYGLPRIGNQAFADYVDAHVSSFTRINNKHDPVPILPGRFLGFHHPSGEIHIDNSNAWISCPGQDNTNSECEVGAVPNIFVSDESDHDGPYDGVRIAC